MVQCADDGALFGMDLAADDWTWDGALLGHATVIVLLGSAAVAIASASATADGVTALFDAYGAAGSDGSDGADGADGVVAAVASVSATDGKLRYCNIL